jgi:hypothetical protein
VLFKTPAVEPKYIHTFFNLLLKQSNGIGFIINLSCLWSITDMSINIHAKKEKPLIHQLAE